MNNMKWILTAVLVTFLASGVFSGQSKGQKCLALEGDYVLQGEDGQVHISIRQDGCTNIAIIRETGYLGKITREEHRFRVDGTTQPDSGWYGGTEKYQGTAHFTPSELRIELRALDGTMRTMLFSLTPKGDLLEDSLTNGKRLGGGPTVAKRQK
jgi:hypothetical protein